MKKKIRYIWFRSGSDPFFIASYRSPLFISLLTFPLSIPDHRSPDFLSSIRGTRRGEQDRTNEEAGRRVFGRAADPGRRRRTAGGRCYGRSGSAGDDNRDHSIRQRTKMDANRRQSGIQQLLAAEQEAQQIVNAARAAKSARLRQAKEEAEREIAEYRAQMEAEFQRKVAESSGDSGANVKRLEQETAEKIAQLKQQAASISPEVIQMLLRYVTTVKN
uniref:V-type proton ATPase subunit G n=2 Tax=Leersia perrieri TaxID=77586 RepID=A0A0D9W927_9ORYZ